ncbi:MAG: zinc ribbon domain-containing protein [Treponema sp.]|jgi:hypothetical protein|nr:zinc ribbon domain-containing protein [Treponema sp.]
MFCLFCGKELPEGAFFCSYCGKKLAAAGQPQLASECTAAKPQAAYAPAGSANPVSFLEMLNPVNGSTYRANVDPQTLINLNGECKDNRDYEDWIDNLNGLHPMLKDIFKGLVKFTVTAGKIIFHMGKVILNFVIKLVKEFSHTIAGIIAGFVLGTIFSSIPLIGWALGPIIVPLFTTVGGIAGFMEDMSRKMNNADMERKVKSSIMDKLGALGLNF